MREGTLTLNQRRIQVTRLEIARAALGILGDRGWEAVSVAELAHAAGVSTRTFHRYFPSKVDVIRPLLEFAGGRAQETFAKSDEPDFAERCAVALVDGIKTFPGGAAGAHRSYRLIMRNPGLMPVWLDESYLTEHALRSMLVAPVFDDGVAADPDSPIDDVRLSVAILFVSFRIAVETWIDGDDPDALHGLCVRSVNQALRRGAR